MAPDQFVTLVAKATGVDVAAVIAHLFSSANVLTQLIILWISALTLHYIFIARAKIKAIEKRLTKNKRDIEHVKSDFQILINKVDNTNQHIASITAQLNLIINKLIK